MAEDTPAAAEGEGAGTEGEGTGTGGEEGPEKSVESPTTAELQDGAADDDTVMGEIDEV